MVNLDLKNNFMFHTGSMDALKLDKNDRRYMSVDWGFEIMNPKKIAGIVTTNSARTKPHLYKQNGLWRCRHYAGASYAGQTPKDAYDLMQIVVTRN